MRSTRGVRKSSLVDREHYLLACYRYIDLNPVRAATVAAPEDYRWSSHAHNDPGCIDLLATPHPAHQGIRIDVESRAACYRPLIAQGTSDDELAMIRTDAQCHRAIGTNRFQQAIELPLGRRAGIGRPVAHERCVTLEWCGNTYPHPSDTDLSGKLQDKPVPCFLGALNR